MQWLMTAVFAENIFDMFVCVYAIICYYAMINLQFP